MSKTTATVFPSQSSVRRRLALPLLLVLVATLTGGGLGLPGAHADGPEGAAGVVGDFEVDGNKADDSDAGEPIDWDTPPPNLTNFVDLSNSSDDDAFGKGSKQLEPGDWTCVEQKVPAKNDLESGQIAFRTLNGDQFLYANWIRRAEQGDAHIGFEFNQSSQPNPSCPDVPQRTDGDVLVTFDTKEGGKIINVGFFRWQFTGPGVGVFNEIDVGEKHETWDAAVNIPPEKSPPGLDPGTFGELSLNLTAALGRPIECDEFSNAYVKSRASSSENAALKDFIKPKSVNIGQCPDSELDKGVRNVTDGEADFSDSTTADPGDELEYQLKYTNSGPGQATEVTITDELDERENFLSCTAPDEEPGAGECTTADDDGDGNLELTWTLGTVEAGGMRTVTYRVELDGTFPEGATEVTNAATVTTAEEDQPTTSDQTTVTVTAAPEIEIDKKVPAGPHDVGDTVTVEIDVTNTGNADATVDITDDYDQDHVDVTNVSDHGTSQEDDGDIITWTKVEVPAGQTVTLSYDATFKGPFVGAPGGGGCDAGNNEFPVSNTAMANGASDTETTCVIANPEFVVTKAVSDETADIGQTVTFTITVKNVGDATGTTDVTDDYDETHANVDDASIDPPATTHNTLTGEITWADRTLDPDEVQVFTYEATFEGPFLAGAGTEGCDPDRFPVVNTVTVSGDSDSQTVCVRAEPGFVVDKTASQDTAQVGESVTMTITVTNEGDAPGSTEVFDDYDEDHALVSDIDPPGDHDEANGTITWTSDELDPNESQQFTYTATFTGTFTEGEGTGGCGEGEFPVVNTVTVEGDTATETVCVTPEPPDLTIEKATDPAGLDEVTAGETITYTIKFGNDGGATATDVTITDEHGSDVEFVSCTGPTGTEGDCEQLTGNKIRWHVGDVDPGETGSVAATFQVTENVGCVVCDTVTITADNADPESVQLCITGVPVPRPDLANAHDSAFGAHVLVEDPTLGVVVNTTLVPVHSSQSGIDSDSQSDQIGDVNIVPPDGNFLRADVLRTASTSTITGDSAQARHVSVAEAAGVNVLDGTVTADLVRAVAETTATGSSSAFSSVGSTHKNLKVDVDGAAGPAEPRAVNDVTPNTRIDLDPEFFGENSYVVVYERDGSTTTPADDQLEGGTYEAGLTVNMVRIHVTGLEPLEQAVDITVSQAKAHSDFPQTTLCDPVPIQAVSGHAFVLSALTDPDLAPTVVGFTSIPANGGFDHQNLDEADVPADGSTANAGASVSETSGQLTDEASLASAFAEVAEVCLLQDQTTGDCTVLARLARSESNSAADSGGATTNDGDGDGDGDTVLVDLVVDGVVITETPEPNTVIELAGIGFLVLNEQFCDEGPAPTQSGPVDCSGDVAAGRTVRSLRLVILDPASGGNPGAEVIVAEAHSDARFVSP